ncbi:class I SAM-dependent methyltransferase [Piscinibacter sp. HJYY11]|uniref:class I SAM-dependent methyltransferase n=1 Tax=Piscinibacter sp. HJYY11 TaxID=2801333 RepID=UPI00191E79DE|nr:class I SAM-dependent methyltransferase [Piscinibacter sp. HJYY11]MBL0727939.1 class I SAM-dependent methyltransferase [Piscinibacter sp. HJYY11]
MDDTSEESAEAQAVRERYARRTAQDPRYSLLNPAALWPMQERQRAMLALFRRLGWHDLSALRLHEVGCGSGSNLVELIQMGFDPAKLSGVELLPERYAQARERLPRAVSLSQGDALVLSPAASSVDIVLQSTVFSSLLDDAFQQRLADAMWGAVKPGGGVLWYDFTVDNPRNKDVRGVPLSRVRQLFPQARVTAQKVTLAPPIARAVVRVHPALYTLFNAVPLLRTHVLCWLAKP